MELYIPLHTTPKHSLLEGCIKGDRLQQKQLYEKYHGRMMAVCLRYAGDREEARDILNEGFMKVFKNIAKFQPKHSLESWMRRIMVNTAIDHYRKNKKHRKQVDLEYAEHEYDQSLETPIGSLSAGEILEAVQCLTPGYRMVFSLYVMEGYNHAEIAEELGISEGTSKSNLSKARAKLQQILIERYGETFARYKSEEK